MHVTIENCRRLLSDANEIHSTSKGMRRLISASIIAIAASLILYAFSESDKYYPPQKEYSPDFVRVASGVYRQSCLWRSNSGAVVDVHTFLLEVGPKSYVLVDVGAPGPEFEALLLNGLQVILKEDGQLRLVVLTHGHNDHVGSLSALSKQYPDVQVAFHEDESPFLIGGSSYQDIPGPPTQVTDFDVKAALPDSRVLLLKGSGGDVANAQRMQKTPLKWLAGAAKPKWLPPKETLSYIHAPGHAPGQVAYLHHPSKSLIAGDVIGNMGALSLPYEIFTPNMTQAKESVLSLRSVDFKRIFAAHDRQVGVSKQRIQKWLKSLED